MKEDAAIRKASAKMRVPTTLSFIANIRTSKHKEEQKEIHIVFDRSRISKAKLGERVARIADNLAKVMPLDNEELGNVYRWSDLYSRNKVRRGKLTYFQIRRKSYMWQKHYGVRKYHVRYRRGKTRKKPKAVSG